jgi:hypothetical protein
MNVDIMMSDIEISSKCNRFLLLRQLGEVNLQVYIPLIYAVFDSAYVLLRVGDICCN